MKGSRSDPKVTFACPQELHDRLIARAEAEERTLSVVVRRAVREYLDRHATPDIAKGGDDA